MYSSNLISLLKTFSKDEYRSFGKFIRSPFFNTHKDVTGFYAYLKKFYPAFTGKNFAPEAAFGYVYPGRKFRKNEFLKLSSSLNKLAVKFLSFSLDKFYTQYSLLNHYADRNLGKQFKSLYEKLNDYIDNRAELDNLIFVKKIFIETTLIRFYMNRDRQKDICGGIIKRGNYFAFQSLMWIMIQKRDMAANYNAFNYEYKESPANEFIESVDIEKLAGGLKYEDTRLGRFLKYYVYCMMITFHPEKQEYFRLFKESFAAVYNEVNRLERNNYLARMQTYVMKHAHKGNMRYLSGLLETYRFFFTARDVFENDYIPVPPLRNSIAVAQYLKDSDFLKELAENFSSNVHPDYRKDTKNLCRAYGEFGKRNYTGVLDSLKIFSYNYPAHKADVKHLLLKTYFESGEYGQLESHIDSFRHFVSKNRALTPNLKNKYLELMSAVNHLAKAREKQRKDDITWLIHNINNYDLNIFDKIWLMEKLEESA